MTPNLHLEVRSQSPSVLVLTMVDTALKLKLAAFLLSIQIRARA